MRYLKNEKPNSTGKNSRYYVEVSKCYSVNGYEEVLTFKMLAVEATTIVEAIEDAFRKMKTQNIVDAKAKYVAKDYYADDYIERVYLRTAKKGEEILFTVTRNKIENEKEEKERTHKTFIATLYKIGKLIYKTLEVDAVDAWDALDKTIQIYNGNGDIKAWNCDMSNDNPSKAHAKVLVISNGIPERYELMVVG